VSILPARERGHARAAQSRCGGCQAQGRRRAMTDGTVRRERYCLRWERTDWGRDQTNYRCAECGQRVIDDADDDVRRICTECLVRDSPPHEPVVVHGNDPWHCLECFDRMRPSGKLPPSNWWGA